MNWRCCAAALRYTGATLCTGDALCYRGAASLPPWRCSGAALALIRHSSDNALAVLLGCSGAGMDQHLGGALSWRPATGLALFWRCCGTALVHGCSCASGADAHHWRCYSHIAIRQLSGSYLAAIGQLWLVLLLLRGQGFVYTILAPLSHSSCVGLVPP